jgi:hypothetical protein
MPHGLRRPAGGSADAPKELSRFRSFREQENTARQRKGTREQDGYEDHEIGRTTPLEGETHRKGGACDLHAEKYTEPLCAHEGEPAHPGQPYSQLRHREIHEDQRKPYAQSHPANSPSRPNDTPYDHEYSVGGLTPKFGEDTARRVRDGAAEVVNCSQKASSA